MKFPISRNDSIKSNLVDGNTACSLIVASGSNPDFSLLNSIQVVNTNEMSTA